MNLKHLSDPDLLNQTKRLAREEQRIGIEVLWHLREIESRRLYASLGRSSLFEYVTGELGYAEGSAYRRISAMRLLGECPEYEAKLQAGSATVSTLSQVQSFLIQEKRQLGRTYSKEEKLGLLAQVEGKSHQQTERVLAELSPQISKPDTERALNASQTEIRFTAGRELMEKLERLKNLMGHKSDTQSFAGLIEELADLALKKWDPAEKKVKETALPTSEVEENQSDLGSRSRYIPAAVRQAVWRRDGGTCSFYDAKLGRRCHSRHALEVDHIRPFAKGGTSDVGNLRLLCRAHNQFQAIREFGIGTMGAYLMKGK